MGESLSAPDCSHERSQSLPDCFAKAANALCLLHKHWEPPLLILAVLREHPALLCLTASPLIFLPFSLTPLFRKAAGMETILAPRGAEEILECNLAVPVWKALQPGALLLPLLTWAFRQQTWAGNYFLATCWAMSDSSLRQPLSQCISSKGSNVAPRPRLLHIWLAWGIARGSASACTCLVRLHLEPSCKFPSPQHVWKLW